MDLIHIIGPRCAGKTRLLDELRVSERWDVLRFYKRTGCLDGQMINWDRFRTVQHRIAIELHRWVTTTLMRRSVAVVESSGINQVLNDALRPWRVVHVCLEPPSEMELQQRCAQVGIPEGSTRRYNSKWLGKYYATYPMLQMLSYEQAYERVAHMLKRRIP
jgi:hypothetical protein